MTDYNQLWRFVKYLHKTGALSVPPSALPEAIKRFSRKEARR